MRLVTDTDNADITKSPIRPYHLVPYYVQINDDWIKTQPNSFPITHSKTIP